MDLEGGDWQVGMVDRFFELLLTGLLLLSLVLGALMTIGRAHARRKHLRKCYAILVVPTVIGLLADFPLGGFAGALVACTMLTLFGIFAGMIKPTGTGILCDEAAASDAGAPSDATTKESDEM